jgi:Ras homolog enriched in brain
VQYVEEHFVDSYYPTIENQFTKPLRFKGVDYRLDIVDTAGQDEFSVLNRKDFHQMSGFVLAYSVASRGSFEMIPIIRDKILNSLGTDDIPCVIVGNKSDLHLQRQIQIQEGRSLAKQLGCAFVETSARHNENITRIFELILLEITKREVPEIDGHGSKCIIC